MVTFRSVEDVLKSIRKPDSPRQGYAGGNDGTIHREHYEPWECLCDGRGVINFGFPGEYKTNEHGRTYFDTSKSTPARYVWCRCQQEETEGSWIRHCVYECGVALPVLERLTFNTWVDALNPGCVEARKMAERHASGKTSVPWLILQSSVGLGKTHLLIAATGVLASRGVEVLYYSAPKLIQAIRASIDDNTTSQIMRRLTSVRALIIDDLGAEYSTDWTNSNFHAILDGRYNEQKMTFLATNLPLSQFPPRLYSRFRDWAVVDGAAMEGTDVRNRERG